MLRNIEAYLKDWKNKANRKPLLIKGPRQVGKTYSLKQFGGESFKKLHYLNFEKDESLKKIFEPDLKPQRILQEISFYTDNLIDTDNDLLVFDEIQECPRAITSLKYFSEEVPQLAVCGAGSLLGLHLGESNFPVGNVEILQMYPLSFTEFLAGIGDGKSYEFIKNFDFSQPISEIVHAHLWKRLKEYFVVGGLPEVILNYKANIENLYLAFNEARKKQSNLIIAYLADIAKHSGKENSMHIERLWRNVPVQLAKTHDGSSSKFKFKGVIPGIEGYLRLSGAIDWLKTAGLILQIHIVNNVRIPLSAYIKENFFKLYFFDVGMLGAISELSPKTILDYDYGSYKGYFAENFIAQELITSAVTPFCWKGRTAEVEFILQLNENVLPIEIKSGWVTQAKSLKIFSEKYNPKFRTIMSANNINIDKTNRVYKIPIYLAGSVQKISS
jgi:predicted AAA+ superfamily ATPase